MASGTEVGSTTILGCLKGLSVSSMVCRDRMSSGWAAIGKSAVAPGPSSVATSAADSAARTARAVWNRSSRDFASRRAITDSSAGDALGHRERNAGGGTWRCIPITRAALQLYRERLAVEELHRDVRATVAGPADVVDPDDSRVILELRPSADCTFQKNQFGWLPAAADRIELSMTSAFTTETNRQTDFVTRSVENENQVLAAGSQRDADHLTVTVRCSMREELFSAAGTVTASI